MHYVLYHANCHDGFGAAWVAHKRFGNNAEYIPCSYGKPMPEIPDGSDVLIADFSFPRDQLEALAPRSNSIKVLDHHKTAQADLEGLPFCEFDMDRSGAKMTWDYLFPRGRTPALVSYIQDRDLWKWELIASKAVNAWIGSFPFDFMVWDQIASRMEGPSAPIIDEGNAILRYKKQMVADQARHPEWIVLGGHRVPVVNASVMFSEVGEWLCEAYPEAKFAGSYKHRNDGKIQWSLRSRNGFDVSEVARLCGGGGHAAAAGFVTPNTFAWDLATRSEQ